MWVRSGLNWEIIDWELRLDLSTVIRYVKLYYQVVIYLLVRRLYIHACIVYMIISNWVVGEVSSHAGCQFWLLKSFLHKNVTTFKCWAILVTKIVAIKYHCHKCPHKFNMILSGLYGTPSGSKSKTFENYNFL